MSFTTVEQVALFLNRDISDFTDLELAQISMTIPFIDGVINNYCGWNMLATDYTDKRYDGTGTDTLDLCLYPINSVTSVRDRASDGTFTENVDSIEYLAEDGVLMMLPYAQTTTFNKGSKNFFITFNAGFTQANMPHELAYAGTYLVALNCDKITDESIGLTEENFEKIKFTNSSVELPVLVKRSLDRFRLVSIF